MKRRFTLKYMLIATVCCITVTLTELLKAKYLPVNITNHQDFEAILFWIVLLIGWAVYFLDLFRNRRKQNENDEKAG